MAINLPEFVRTVEAKRWIESEVRTARFINVLWSGAGQRKRDPRFILLIISCAWVNVANDEAAWEATRVWRNRKIAWYLNVSNDSEVELANEISRVFPNIERPLDFLKIYTGITHYYKPNRPVINEMLKRKKTSDIIIKIFNLASSKSIKSDQKIAKIMDMFAEIGPVQGKFGGKVRNVSPIKAMTPALACLDPSRRFPIMNERTARLLRLIDRHPDRDGAIALFNLIGQKGIRNSFDLDVYSQTQHFSQRAKIRQRILNPYECKGIGIKSEVDSLTKIGGGARKLRKLHNKLTNRFSKELEWRYVVKEYPFDALVLDWRRGRKLLVEAKTAWHGCLGRTQVRLAIGQLFDYRKTHFGDELTKVDLAVLLPSKPSRDIVDLLINPSISKCIIRRRI